MLGISLPLGVPLGEGQGDELLSLEKSLPSAEKGYFPILLSTAQQHWDFKSFSKY